MTDQDGGQDEGRRTGNPGAGEEQPISVSIDSFHRTYKTSNDKSGKRQRKSLRWTRATGVAAWFYTVLTAALLSASGYTAIQATIATNATTHQAQIAEDTEHRQLRSYIQVVEPVVNVKENMPTPVILTIQMIGQTPAYDVQIYLRGGQSGEPIKATDFSLNKDANFVCRQRGVLYPFPDKISVPYVDKTKLTIDEVSQIMTQGSKRRYYIGGQVTYRDSFQCWHWVNYCYVLSGGPAAQECPGRNNTDDPGRCFSRDGIPHALQSPPNVDCSLQ